MKKEVIIVPKGIRFISEWKELEDQLPEGIHYIMNKTITGCGYTEYCITNDKPVIICSPRKVLLENKSDQHSSEENVLYLRDEYSTFQPFDKDISKDDKSLVKTKVETEEEITKSKLYSEEVRQKIIHHRTMCAIKGLPCKYLVTYDSFRRIREALGETILDTFTVVVDEFQSMFTDARFKSDTENTFLNNLQKVKNVVYLSATPMMDKYLEELDEFKDLPYYELDWSTEDPSRVVTPYLKTKLCTRGIVEEVRRIVEEYRSGDFEKITRKGDDGLFEIVYSKEAVIYVNSIKNITEIIKKCELKPEEVNILCSDDERNEKKIRDAFRTVDKTLPRSQKYIGKVPKQGETHKMFTLCTRTVYLGADFYSTSARSFIFSDANIDCLSVDITLDLPQILGRQRLNENPWKNRAELYYKLNTKELSEEDFNNYLEIKKKKTESLLNAYNTVDSSDKHNLAEAYQKIAHMEKYKGNFVAVDEHAGSDLVPIFNKLVMIAEMRAFEIQQTDYKDRFSVFNSLAEAGHEVFDVNAVLDTIYGIQKLSDRYRYLCSLDPETVKLCLPQLPESFTNYYVVLGPTRMKALGFNATDMRKEYEGIIGNQNIDIGSKIYESFRIGEKYTKTYIKNKLGTLYSEVGYKKTPKAVDLSDYFILNTCRINNEETGKRDAGYLIVSKKE